MALNMAPLGSEKDRMYIFDSDLGWQMQLIIIKAKDSCFVCREF